MTWGANAIYDIVDGKLEFRSYFKLPAPQLEQENCVAHNGSIVPVPGRDLFVQAWYQGGLSIMDFTDSANPVEIAYFDRGPIDAEELVVGGYWSSYWYDGHVYATEIVRGLDVFALTPIEHLTAGEIAAARLADQGRMFNPQQQFAVTWPATPVVARAYLDQLTRAGRLPGRAADELTAALERAESVAASGGRDRALSRSLRALAAEFASDSAALSETLEALAVSFR